MPNTYFTFGWVVPVNPPWVVVLASACPVALNRATNSSANSWTVTGFSGSFKNLTLAPSTIVPACKSTPSNSTIVPTLIPNNSFL